MSKYAYKLAGIALSLSVCVSTAALAQSEKTWEGTWETSYGPIEFVENGKHVYGDYQGDKTIEGVLSKDGMILRALFRYPDGRSGVVEFVQSGDDGNRISGKWIWTNQNNLPLPKWDVKDVGGNWRGTRRNTARPRIDNFRTTPTLPATVNAAQGRYRPWMSTIANMTFAEANARTSAPRTGGPPISDGLNFGRALTPSKLATAYKMQEHVAAVSEKGGQFSSSGEVAAKAAFEEMGYTLLGRGIITTTDSNYSLARASIARLGKSVVVTFRGTGGDNFIETAGTAILSDARVAAVPPSFVAQNRRGTMLVHKGFLTTYMKLRGEIVRALSVDEPVHLYITGHSLGGAMASLMGLDMALNFPNRFSTITVITSGAPRVGNSSFKNNFERAVPDNLRIILNRDPVPTVPWFDGKYVHAGRSLVLTEGSGALVPHADQDVYPNVVQFPYHANEKYKDTVFKLAQNAARNSNLNPYGDAWANAATKSFYDLSKERSLAERARNAAQGAKDKARDAADTVRGWLGF